MSRDEPIVKPLTSRAKYERLCLRLAKEILKREMLGGLGG